MKTLSCADLGSKYCPCHLAYSKDCIGCNMLNKNEICDCIWQGVCVYNEVNHNKKFSVVERQEYLCNIKNITLIEENTYLINVEIPKEISKDLCNPGAYVLVKSEDKKSNVFSAPISVMDVDLDTSNLEMVIKTVGVKTKDIIKFNKVYIKGPYFNGLFGKNFSRTSDIPFNAALNYGYGILLSAVNREIVSNGYITQLGLFHDNMFNPFNLGSDLMEPFRVFIDKKVFEMKPEKLEHEEKMALVYGIGGEQYQTAEEAEANMVEIAVPVWRLQEDGSKTSGTAYLQVNKNLAPIYEAIFEEIYNGDEQFPIKDVGCYSWRTGEHSQGTAVDINWDENMEATINADGSLTPTTGSHWSPGEDPYSIPEGGDVYNAFTKYGFSWGGNAWTSKRDYMHFSYFGR